MANIIYGHSVKEKNSIKSYGPDTVDAVQIDNFERFIKEKGAKNFVKLEQAINGKETKNKFVLTFDDGHRDFLTNVIPVLEIYNTPATLFVTTSVLDGIKSREYLIEEIIENTPSILKDVDSKIYHIQSNIVKHQFYIKVLNKLNKMNVNKGKEYLDQLKRINEIELKTDSTVFLSWDDLILLKKHPLVQIGSHCIHHDRLPTLSLEKAKNEMKLSKEILEGTLDITVKYISYPYGDIDFFSNIMLNNIGYEMGFVTGMRKRYHFYPYKKWLIPRIDLKNII